MNNLIELLKKNRYAFGMWPDPECYGEKLGKAMQEKAREIPKEHFNVYEGNFSNAVWGRCNKGSGAFCIYQTYRLCSDYEDELEIEECEIALNPESNTWGYKCPCSGDPVNADLAHSCPGFRLIGFKFKDEIVMGSPVKYSVPGITSHGYYATYEDLKTSQALEHHATHVLFRRKKQE